MNKMKILELIRAYIAGGDIPPDQRTGCPSGQHPALWMGGMPPPAPAGTSSQIKNSRRGSRGTSRPLDGREVPDPMPSAQSAGGRYPFFKKFPTGTPFPNFIFYLFLKKNSPAAPRFSNRQRARWPRPARINGLTSHGLR
jgi:hypothetical protein